MKINKTISISQELRDLLKDENNASALIDGLLQEHYKINDELGLKVDKIGKLIIEKEELQTKLRKTEEDLKYEERFNKIQARLIPYGFNEFSILEFLREDGTLMGMKDLKNRFPDINMTIYEMQDLYKEVKNG